MFAGGRGRPALDIAAAGALIERCGELLLARDLELIELNPVLIGDTGAIALDASIRVRSVDYVHSESDEPPKPRASASPEALFPAGSKACP
jgi:succinyl-CoA synthetase beta subunit